MDVPATLCQLESDNQIGPRINPACRSFDFTLLFEDAFFIALPASIFIVTLSIRLTYVWSIPAKLTSYRLALWKLPLLFGILVLHLTFLAVRLESPSLNTNMSLASGILSVIATMGTCVESFLEDQRSIRPSDLIVLYQSATMVLAIPRLRTIWLLSSVLTLKVVWTGISILTTGTVLIESVGKYRLLKWVHLRAVITCLDC
jgi:ATP-binding cassette subfamily C (CFTR/MRP) protein 1